MPTSSKGHSTFHLSHPKAAANSFLSGWRRQQNKNDKHIVMAALTAGPFHTHEAERLAKVGQQLLPLWSGKQKAITTWTASGNCTWNATAKFSLFLWRHTLVSELKEVYCWGSSAEEIHCPGRCYLIGLDLLSKCAMLKRNWIRLLYLIAAQELTLKPFCIPFGI